MKKRTINKDFSVNQSFVDGSSQLDLFKKEPCVFDEEFEKFEHFIDSHSIEEIIKEFKLNGKDFFLSVFKENNNKILEKIKNKQCLFIVKELVGNNWFDGVTEENILVNVERSCFKNVEKFDLIIDLFGEETIASVGKINFLDRKEIYDFLRDYLYYYGVSSKDCFLKLLTASKMIDFKFNTLENVKSVEEKIVGCEKIKNLISYKNDRSSNFKCVDMYWENFFFNNAKNDYQSKQDFKNHFNKFNEEFFLNLEDDEFVSNSLSSFWFYFNHFGAAYKKNSKIVSEEAQYKIFRFLYGNLLNCKNEKLIEISKSKKLFSEKISEAFQLRNNAFFSETNLNRSEERRSVVVKNRF